MDKARLRPLLWALIAALAVTALCGLGALKRPDKWVQDALFQRPAATSPEIVLIGIDEKALAELGPYNTWGRDIMARALESLAAEPDRRPAVVALDTLYAGESDRSADARLAAAAEELGCVVTASAAEFGSRLTEADGRYSLDNYAVLRYEEPYAALKAVTVQGHINAMADMDGILRHAVWYVEPEAGERVYSMAWETVRLYLEKTGGELTEPYPDGQGHFYGPFTARPGDFYDGVSLADLITGRVPADYYAGKIVLIGPYAAGLQDAYFTPIDRAAPMYGMEVQANVIQSLLEGNVKREVSDWLQASALLAICFAAMLFYRKKKVGPSGLACLALVLGGLGAALGLYAAGLIIHPLWIPAGALVIYIISIIIHYVNAALERQRVTRTFERYVAPEIVRELLKEGTDALELGGKTCDIAVLFVDVRGFTTMSERLSPQEVVFILNRYLDMTSRCVAENRGTLDKFVGDATMAFWGAPLPQEDAAYLAAKTALDIVRGAEELSAQLKKEIGEELHVGVGVNFGPAVVGNMGSLRRMDYTAIGDTVNTAARLESNAPGSTVYISRAVADELGDRAKTTSLGGSIRLKGKAEGFEVLKLENLE